MCARASLKLIREYKEKMCACASFACPTIVGIRRYFGGIVAKISLIFWLNAFNAAIFHVNSRFCSAINALVPEKFQPIFRTRYMKLDLIFSRLQDRKWIHSDWIHLSSRMDPLWGSSGHQLECFVAATLQALCLWHCPCLRLDLSVWKFCIDHFEHSSLEKLAIQFTQAKD